MMSNVIMNEYVQLVYKTKHSKLKVTSGGPRTHVEPAKGFSLTDDMDVQNWSIQSFVHYRH